MNTTTRVALVYRNFSFGGSLERDVVTLARGLVERGIEVHCYCNPETRNADAEGVVFHDVHSTVRSRSRLGQPLETVSFAASATRALRRDRQLFDVIDVTGVSAWNADVVTVHGVTKALQRRWPEDSGRGYRAARTRAALGPLLRPQIAAARAIERLQFAAQGPRRAIAVTEAVAQDIVDVHGFPRELIDVIHPPVEISTFQRALDGAELRADLGIRPGEILLLFVGHDFARKGLGAAIAALPRLPGHVRLAVVGEGNRSDFEARAAEAGVKERVLFAGRTQHPELYFAAADIFVLPTRQDPWGITLIEAMAAGVPVVTTAAAGSSAAVRAAGAGLVLDDDSPSALAAAVASLVDDPVLRQELGLRGPAAAEPFGAAHHVELVLQTYERALAVDRPAVPSPASVAA
jgi:UDP-glucose:(heptosyl)LPS alpha-1,3-glucosyltransferase